MAITAGVLLGKASKILQDETNIRWPVSTEMLGWLDSAQREVVLLKPALLTNTAARILIAGTKQVLPASSLGLADIPRNMGTNGTTPGRAITAKPREIMDNTLPDWHNTTASAEVKHFFYDQRSPKEYYVWPPQPTSAQGYVEEIRFIAPTALVDVNTNISLDDIYEGVLINLVLSRAYAKDSEHTYSAERSQGYRMAALETLGLRAAVEEAAAPVGKIEKASR